MLRYTLRQPLDGADFSLPVPNAWRAKALHIVRPRPGRPMMVLRPLVDRTEWGGCDTRNPDPKAYAALYNAIRSRFFVVSIADLVDRVEWICGDHLDADVALHAGELDAEALVGLIASAALTFCSPGFALIASQAVGTPVISVYGGRESSRFYEYGARFAPTLGIDPVLPCDCFLPKHQCDKRIDLDCAHARIAHFLDTHVEQHEFRRRA
jgi:ADP-heptose:LPS heptosyltransferase